MTTPLDPNLVILAHTEVYRRRADAELLQMKDPSLQVLVKSPAVNSDNSSAFSRCMASLCEEGRLPSVLIVDHYAKTSHARDILEQFISEAPQTAPLPSVVLFSAARYFALKEEAGIIRREMPFFPLVEIYRIPTFDKSLYTCVREVSQVAIDHAMAYMACKPA